MGVVFDTTTVEPAERFDAWRDSVRQLWMPLELKRHGAGDFSARAWACELCGIKIGRVFSSDAVTISRTSRAVTQLDPESLLVIVGIRGRTALTQGARTSVCGPGDITIFDSSRPHRAEALTPTDVLSFVLPKAMMHRDVARLSAHAAERVAHDSGRSRLVRPYLCRLAGEAESGELRGDELELAEGVLTLVAALFASGRPMPRPDMLLRLKAYVEERLGDAGLGADALAEAHYISRRTVYRLFNADGTGVQEWIRLRRLERCKQELGDPAHAHESVVTIALRWGFVNPGSFTRAFREQYGPTPREHRHMSLKPIEATTGVRDHRS